MAARLCDHREDVAQALRAGLQQKDPYTIVRPSCFALTLRLSRRTDRATEWLKTHAWEQCGAGAWMVRRAGDRAPTTSAWSGARCRPTAEVVAHIAKMEARYPDRVVLEREVCGLVRAVTERAPRGARLAVMS